MSIIHEETERNWPYAEITVSQRTKGESIKDWYIVHLRTESMDRMTPADLCVLGRWLIEHGERIKREYTKTGKPKATQPAASSRGDGGGG